MTNSVTCWLLFVVLLFLAIDQRLAIAPQLYSNVDESRSCEVTNLHFWRLINWFFERTTYVVIAAISGTNITRSHTATTFIRELSKSKHCIPMDVYNLVKSTCYRCSIYHYD